MRAQVRITPLQPATTTEAADSPAPIPYVTISTALARLNDLDAFASFGEIQLIDGWKT